MVLVVTSLAVAACGTAPETEPVAEGTGTAETSPEPTATEEDPFPVTVEHKYGQTTIESEPERVVALGYQEEDALLALGVTPVAVRYWFGDESKAVFPWAEDELGDAEPEILNMPFGELDIEKIATLEPDLISAVYSGITEEEYNKLSEIAPTITQTDDYVDFGMPWQEMTEMVGRAVGKAEEAEQIVADVEAQFEAAREAHPEFVGSSIAVASGLWEGQDQYFVYSSEDIRTRVFTLLGFEVPARFDEIAGEAFYGQLSKEQTELLDRDLIVFQQMQFVAGGQESIEGDPLIQQLDAVKEGRVVYLSGKLDDALQYSTVLSLPVLLEDLVPMLEAAMDGDPETAATQPAA